jgi:hypothetical protein
MAEQFIDILLQLALCPLGLLGGLLGGLFGGGGGGGGAQPIQSAPMPETEDLGQIPQQLTKNTSATLTSSLLDDNNMIDQEFKEDQVQEQARQQSAPISPTTQKARESEPMEMPVNPAINQEKPGGLLQQAIDDAPEPAPVKSPITPPEPTNPAGIPQPPQQQQQPQQQLQGPLRNPITTQFSIRR